MNPTQDSCGQLSKSVAACSKVTKTAPFAFSAPQASRFTHAGRRNAAPAGPQGKFRIRPFARTRPAGAWDLACSLTSTRDVVSAGQTRSHSPTKKIAEYRTTSNMLKLECNCFPEYKIATLSFKIAYLPKKQNILKRPQRTYRLQEYYTVHIHTKLIADSIPPLRKSKSPTC